MQSIRLYAGRCLLFGFLISIPLAHAAVYKVGQDKPYKRPSEVAGIVRDGDIVEIDAGNYLGDVAVWKQHNLTLRGVGGLAHLQANGQAAQGKAIWVIQGNNATVEQIEFSGSTVPDRNGAGLRLEGLGVSIRNCYFHDNENGILGGGGEVLVESSEFARNGFGDGRSHNIYISDKTKKFTLRYSYSHHAKVGHNVKTRAPENWILYNRIMDEHDGKASYAIDFSDGGMAYVIGNLIQQGPMAENSTLLTFAAEGARHPKNELYAINNTFVNDYGQGRFIAVGEGSGTVRIVNNIFLGPGAPANRPMEKQTNLVASDDAGLLDRKGFDYRLSANSPAIDAGSDPGTAYGFHFTPVSQYAHPRQREARAAIGAIDIGAYEFTGGSSGRRKASHSR